MHSSETEGCFLGGSAIDSRESNQAGADAHEDDPLGGWLTTEEMIERDRIVFETLARKGIPVAWNLAGGYQEPIERVLALHGHTMRVALEVERGGAGGVRSSAGG